jgi:hypothetical protein
MYFLMFPSGWKQFYHMFVEDPKFGFFYLLSYRYTKFGNTYLNELNSRLHTFMNSTLGAVIPAEQALAIVEGAAEKAQASVAHLLPTGLPSGGGPAVEYVSSLVANNSIAI